MQLDYRTTLINLLKNDKQNFVADFEYVWNVGKQIARVIGGLNYIDEELMTVVNEYMVSASKNNFNNGTWSWFYGNANGGQGAIAPKVNSKWYQAIDEALYTFMSGGKNWSNAMEYLTGTEGLLAAYSDQFNNTPKAGISALYLKVQVEEGKDPDAFNSVDKIVAAIKGLSDFGDLTPDNWKGGTSGTFGDEKYQMHYVLDEVMLFAEYKAAAEALEDGAKVDEIKEAVGATKYEKWAGYATEYLALKAITTKYSIVNGSKDSVLNTTFDQATPHVLINGFFNAALTTYDGGKANSKGNLYGYLCMEHKEHFLLSMRALYLRKFMKDNEINFSLVEDMLEAMEDLESTGTSKYTGVTETEGAVMDFDYLWTMAKQIKRIKDGNIKALDNPLREAITSLAWYMRPTTESGYTGQYGTTNSFYNLSLCVRYRDGGKVAMDDVGTTWLRYFGFDGPETWNNLLSTYINPLLGDEYDLIVPGDKNNSESAAIFYVAKPKTTEPDTGAQED